MTEPAQARPWGSVARGPGRARPSAPASTGAPVRLASRVVPLRLPVHVAVTVGVSAGLYATSLAAVTALQAGTDARLAAERAPAAAAVADLRAANASLAAVQARIDASAAAAAAAYDDLATAVGDHEERLAALDAQVSAIEGSASALRVPNVRLPTVTTRSAPAAPRPATNACTTASGKPC